MAHGSSKGWLACGERWKAVSKGQQIPPSLPPGSCIGDYLGCGLGLLVQCSPSVPLAQGGPGLGAEPLGCTASVRLVVSNVVEGPKPCGKIIPSWGRESEITMALWTSVKAHLPF